MNILTSVCLLLVHLVSLSSSQEVVTPGKFDLVAAVNSDGNGQVTRPEVEAFYSSFGGGNAVTRCQFQYRLVEDFKATSRYVSALYDFMQAYGSGGGTWRELTLDEFSNAILKGSTTLPVQDARNNVNTMNQMLQAAMADPHESSRGQNNLTYSAFQGNQWARDFDTDDNQLLTSAEVSSLIRTLDMNRDFGIHRCEFVDQLMTRYRAQPLTANRLFDELFRSQEITWADVDTKFLLYAINNNWNTFVRREKFVEFIKARYDRAAGVVDDTDYGILIPRGNHGLTLTSALWSLLMPAAITCLGLMTL